MNKSTNHIQDLLDKSVEVLKSIDGVEKIAVFGSMANKKHDIYSDLDLEVQTKKFSFFIKNLEGVVHAIGSPFVIFPVIYEENNAVYTILWKNYPFYQKLDLRILDTTHKLSVQSLSPKKVSTGTNIKFDEKMRPFYDFYIGATRYTKHSLRKQHLSSFKFYRAALEAHTNLKFFVTYGFPQSALTITELKYLDEEVKKDEGASLSKYIYLKNLKNMDKNYMKVARSYLDLCINKNLIRKQSKERDFGEAVIEFMHHELS